MSFLTNVIEGMIPGMTAGVRTALPYLVGLSLQGTSLSGPVRRALALGQIPPDQPMLSKREILRQARAAGFRVNTSISLKVIDAARQQPQAHEYIQALSPGRLPLRYKLPYADAHQTYPYHVVVEVVGTNNVTGEIQIQYVTVTRTKLITPAQAKAKAAIAVVDNVDYNMMELTGLQVMTYTKQNPGLQR